MPTPKRLHPADPLWKIAESPWIDELGHLELVVYLRLLGRTHRKGSLSVVMTNAAIHRNPRRVGAALRRLEDRGLVVVGFKKIDGEKTRVISVRR